MSTMDWCKHQKQIALAAGYQKDPNTYWWLSGIGNYIWNFDNRRIAVDKSVCTDPKCPECDARHMDTPPVAC